MNTTRAQLAYRAVLHAPAMATAETRTYEAAAQSFRDAARLFSIGSDVRSSLTRQALHQSALALMAREHSNELRRGAD